MAFLTDLRYSARTFARSPALTVSLVLTIAMGIGGTAGVYGFVRGLIAPNPYLSSIGPLVSAFAYDEQQRPGPLSYADVSSLRRRTDLFERVGAALELQAEVVLDDDWSVVSVAAITPELAELLQLSFDDGVVVSDRVWQLRLDATANVRGKSIRIDDKTTRVSGVAPDWLEGLYLGRPIDVWMPLQDNHLAADRVERRFWAVGRLARGVSLERAKAALTAGRDRDRTIAVLPYNRMTPEMAWGLSRISGLLRSASAAVFVIACANVALFLTTRATSRSHETSIRLALGAGRRQLVRQLFADSLLISAAGAAAGLILALWTIDVVPLLFFEQDASHLVFAPDRTGIAAVTAVCAGVTIACGFIPLLQLRHDHPAAVLQRESTGPSKTIRRLQAGLVVAQMTGCCLLVVCSGVLLQGFRAALQTSLARRLGNAILVTVQARSNSNSPHERAEQGLRYFQDVEAAARSIVDVSTAAWTGTAPDAPPSWQFVRTDPKQMATRDVDLDVALFTPKSLALVKGPPSAGRMFSGADTPEACRVAVVNEEAADQLFGRDTIGRSLENPTGDSFQVVGIIATRKPDKTDAGRPTIFYFEDQVGPLTDRLGATKFHVEKRSTLATVVLDAQLVSPGYFDAMGFASTGGTLFDDTSSASGCRVGVVNQEAADRYFGGNPVGASVIDAVGRRTEIIGVVRTTSLRTVQRRLEPAIYFPMAQDFRPRMTLVLGTRNVDERDLTALRDRLKRVAGGDSGAIAITTLDQHLRRTALAAERIAVVLVSVLAAAAIVLGALGLYGAMADSVRRRRREMALCLALGAQRWRISGRLLGEGVRLAALGTVAGMLGALLVARWLAQIAPTSESTALWVWLAAPVVLTAAVAIASVAPVRRALMINPLTIMRDV